MLPSIHLLSKLLILTRGAGVCPNAHWVKGGETGCQSITETIVELVWHDFMFKQLNHTNGTKKVLTQITTKEHQPILVQDERNSQGFQNVRSVWLWCQALKITICSRRTG